MAETNPELQAKLQELDHELEEGDITQKGLVLSSRTHLHSRCCRCPRRRVRFVPHVR
jgi:hypothetical protein